MDNPDNDPYRLWTKFLKDVENLENPNKPPIVMYKHSRMQNLKSGLSPADMMIMERLEKLREDRKQAAPPSEQELRERLSRLRDEPTVASSSKKDIIKIDRRTDQQKSEDLLSQYMDECSIENQQKGKNPALNQIPIESKTDEQMIQQILEEAALSAACGDDDEDEGCDSPDKSDLSADTSDEDMDKDSDMSD